MNAEAPLPPSREPASVELFERPASLGTTGNLLKQFRTIDWFQFERVIALVYEKLGCTISSRGGANPDGGIDLIIERNGERAAIQCKQWKTWNAGVIALREFFGALTDAEISKGIFITLQGYIDEARFFAEKHGIEVLNETGLAKLIESGCRMSDPQLQEILNDQRKLPPKCENEMVLRIARPKVLARVVSSGAVQPYPRCRFTMPV